MALLSSILVIARYLGCAVLPYCLYVIIYNLSFHPLKQYPGPLLARISDCYPGFFALQRTLPSVTHRNHQQYGDVMRFGPNRLVFNTATALHDIYRHPRVTKSDVYLFSVAGTLPFIFNTIDRGDHLRKRKIISPALSERSMRAFQPVMIQQINVFLDLISPKSESVLVNISPLCRRLAMDIAVHLGFGATLNLQTTTDYDFIFTGTSIANFRINSYMNFPSLSNLQFDLILKNTPMRRRWRGIVADMIQERLKHEPDAKHDFYSFVKSSLNDDKDMQSSELFAESLFILSAAGDTISTTLAGIFFYLSRNTECYERAVKEVRSNFDSDADITNGMALKNCRYLRACINETLRMSPPIGGTLWREVVPEKDQQPLIVDGHVIPPETLVGVNIYSLHHNEKYFPDPFTFNPDRWLASPLTGDEEGDEAITSEMHQAFTPFSVGIRSCAGKAMAYLEASLVIAKALWHFDFEKTPGEQGDVGAVYKNTASGTRVEFKTLDAITSRHDGPYLKFVPRFLNRKEQ